MYVIAKELIGAPGMPATTKGIRQALQRYVQGKSCCSRRRSGSKATEYSIDCLPEVTQQALRERYALQLMTQKVDESPVPVVTKARRSPDVVDAVEAYRGSPQLMVERLNALTEKQRQVAEARIAIVSEVLKFAQQPGFSCARAIRFIVDRLSRSQLDERIVAMVETANAKKGNSRVLSEITLKRWIAAFNKAQNAAERLLLLAPGKRQEIKAEDINWLPEFLAQYRQSNGRPMTEAYEDFVAEWQHRHADEPYMLDIMPSYDTIRRAMKKLPEVVKQKGRVTGSEYRQLEGFTRRDWSRMPVNYVWIGDGHGMKLKCRHPVHGRPFAPEVTFVIDGGTRFVVGWSLDLAENVFAVAGAIQHGIRHHGKPFLYYSDNQYALALYWPVSALPQGVTLEGNAGHNLLASFYVQSDATDLNVMYHKGNTAQNTKLGSFGAFNNEWHTLGFRFAGNNSIEVTPVIDGKDGTPFMLSQSPVGTFTADKLRVTDITKNATYPVLIDSIVVEVNNA